MIQANTYSAALNPPSCHPTVAGTVSDWFQDADANRIKVGNNSYRGTAEKVLDKNEHLYIEGSRQTHIYLVQSGVIGSYKMLSDGRRQIIEFSYPGDVLGLDHSGRYNNSAEALVACKVRCIPIAAIDNLMATDPGFGQSILRATSMALADAREQLVSLGRQSAIEKLASFLLRISRRNTQIGENSDLVVLPMKRADIGDYLGLTIETVSRCISELKKSGMIYLESNSRVRILDVTMLESLANGD